METGAAVGPGGPGWLLAGWYLDRRAVRASGHYAVLDLRLPAELLDQHHSEDREHENHDDPYQRRQPWVGGTFILVVRLSRHLGTLHPRHHLAAVSAGDHPRPPMVLLTAYGVFTVRFA